MMKFVILAIAFLLVSTVSQAKTLSSPVSAYHQVTPWQKATVTRSVLARVKSRAEIHALKAANLLSIDDDDDDDYDDIDMQVAYARPRLTKPEKNLDLEISDHAKIRLMVARARALQVYNKKYT
jgi:hypothetical protein